MNVAIILSGRIVSKDYESSINQLRRTFSKYNTTYFLSINKSVHDEAYTQRFMKDMDITRERVNIETTILPDGLETFKKKKESDYQRTYSMYYHNMRGFELINRYTEKYNTKFDRVVKYRTDIDNTTNNTINLLLCDRETVYVPEGCDFGGINDQIAYGDMETMCKYSQCAKNITKMCESGIVYHPEMLLKKHLEIERVNISRFKYIYKLNYQK
jgi:hypothetical protein